MAKSKKFYFIILLILITACAFTGCRGAAPLRRVNVGMTQKQVRKKIGRPLNVIDSRISKEGEVVEVWEYKANRFGPQRYWLTFVDDSLAEWRRVDEYSMGRPPTPQVTKKKE